MRLDQLLRIVRLVTIVVVIAAIIAPAADLAARGAFDPTRFFAYFTIQSNLIGVVTFGWLLAIGSGPRPPALDRLRGAATLYLTITFFVVIFLLSGADVQLQMVWVDVVLHKVFPIVIVIDWVLDPPRIRITARDVVIWLIYPIGWTLLTVLRGAMDGWYPYPFLDPSNGGYGQVVIAVGAIALGFLVVGQIVRAVGNVRGQGRSGFRG